MESNLKKRILLYFWQPTETHCLNMPISENNSSKSGEFGAFFFTKIFCRIFLKKFAKQKCCLKVKKLTNACPLSKKCHKQVLHDNFFKIKNFVKEFFFKCLPLDKSID